MRYRVGLAIVVAIFSMQFVCSQSLLSRKRLERVRTELDRPMYAAAFSRLLSDADSLLDVEPLSVMMKKRHSPSGNDHDYVSLARYFHPDPDSPDGLTYVNRDGVTSVL